MHCSVKALHNGIVTLTAESLEEDIQLSAAYLCPRSRVDGEIASAKATYPVRGSFSINLSGGEPILAYSDDSDLEFVGVLVVSQYQTRSLLLRSPHVYRAIALEEHLDVGATGDASEKLLDDLAEALGGAPFEEFGDKEREALANHHAEMERAGEFYVNNVEIIFPPQIKTETGWDGVIVDIRDILRWMARDPETENSEREELLHIADKYYSEDEDLMEDDDNLDEAA